VESKEMTEAVKAEKEVHPPSKESVKDKDKPKQPAGAPQFIPGLVGKKVLIRMVSGGQPMSGVIIDFNPYEILVQTQKGQTMIFKSAIATIETVVEGRK
jgi:RNA chaperone Hfq